MSEWENNDEIDLWNLRSFHRNPLIKLFFFLNWDVGKSESFKELDLLDFSYTHAIFQLAFVCHIQGSLDPKQIYYDKRLHASFKLHSLPTINPSPPLHFHQCNITDKQLSTSQKKIKIKKAAIWKMCISYWNLDL